VRHDAAVPALDSRILSILMAAAWNLVSQQRVLAMNSDQSLPEQL
jgi:hypothetical protein